MRHNVKGHRIARSHAHRKATLAALATALIKHKRIETTLAKAKALRVYAEPIINRAKEDTQHNRRQVFRHLQDKEAVTELFGDVAGKISDRPGGYTRVIKLGYRAGDSAEMAVIELVDYNDVRPGGAAGGRRRRTRRGAAATRSRRGAGASKAAAATQAEETELTTDTVEAAETEVPEATPAEEQVPVAEAEAEAPEATAEESEPDSDEEKKAE
jgi:large subunit ribosomal protein L17